MVDPIVSIVIVTWNREDDIVKCIESILDSTYQNFEIVVVDNNSTDNTVSRLRQSFGDSVLIIIKATTAAEGRNVGARAARGKYILFVDSDNIIDKEMIGELVGGIQSLKSAGLIGPLMYYYKDPNRIWCAGAEINMVTSKTIYTGNNENDIGNFNKPREVGHIPNIFMCCRDIFERVDGFDERFQIMYEESDLAEKIKKKSFKIYIYPSARAWHNVPIYSKNEKTLRSFGMETDKKVYLLSRNRIYFMRKNTSSINFAIFIFIFLPLFTLFYISKLIQIKNYKMIFSYLNGVKDGLKFIKK